MRDLFRHLAHQTSEAVGSPWAFCLALLVIVGWVVTGPVFGFSDTWQLVINTGTTIITFLMVFLIQNTQNRDSKVLQLKLDELIRSNKRARNSLIELENLSDDVLNKLAKEFDVLRQKDVDLHHALGPMTEALHTHRQQSKKHG